MALLAAVDVSRHYQLGDRRFLALSNVTTTVEAGEFKVVKGPSGAGKSTLLQLLSGLDKPSSGQVLLRGEDIYQLADTRLSRLRNHSFGFVFQTPHMLHQKSVLDNVLLPSLYAPTGCDYTSRATQLLSYVGLSQLESRSPSTLSGGELQRVGFARALLMDPVIIFADEPTGSLDQAASNRLLDMLREQTDKGRAVVMATHDQQAMSYGSATLILEKQ